MRRVALFAALWAIALAGFITINSFFSYGSGPSMLPTLRSTDATIVDQSANPHVGDIALYHDSLGFYIMHRVVAVDGPYYTFKGDNNDVVDGTYITADRNITRNQIIGKVVLIIHQYKWFLGLVYGIFLMLAILIAWYWRHVRKRAKTTLALPFLEPANPRRFFYDGAFAFQNLATKPQLVPAISTSQLSARSTIV